MRLLSVRIKLCLKRNVLYWQSKGMFSDQSDRESLNTSFIGKLCELLSCSEEKAHFLLRKNKKMLTYDSNRISNVASFCKNNLKLYDVLQYPTIMSLSPNVLNDRISTLKELGCVRTARSILLFDDFMQKTPSKLFLKGFIRVPVTSITHMSQLDCPEDLKLQLSSRLLDLYSDNFELLKIKASVNATYLAWKLQCSEEVATDIVSKQPSLCMKSLDSMERVCKMLLETFELPASKICNLPFILTSDCDNLEELAAKVPKICDISIQHIVKKQPLILKRHAKSLFDTACVLESIGVTDVQLLSCTKILNLRASTISSRIDKLASLENSDVLKSAKKFLWFILYFNNVTETEKIMKSLELPCSPNVLISMFGAHVVAQHFREKSGAKNRCGIADLLFYLSVFFDDTVDAIKMELKNNPNINLSSVQNAQKLIDYLTAKNITQEQLRNGLDIVFYDADVVIQYFTDLLNRKELSCEPFSKWIGHHNLINALIYLIEKDQNFTGNGVFARSAKKQTLCDEDEEMLIEGLALDIEAT